MIYLVYGFIFLTVVLTVLILYEVRCGSRNRVLAKLQTIQTTMELEQDEEDLRKPFVERLIKPAYQNMLRRIAQITPTSLRKKYDSMIANAGSPANVTFNSILAVQLMLALFIGLGLSLMTPPALAYRPLLIFMGASIGFILPISLLNTKARSRRERITQALPDMLDMLHISVEAGLGFDAAMKRAAIKMQGPLSEEFLRALDEIAKGRNREVAFRGIAVRTGVSDLSAFITSVIQTEQLGSNITNMLRIQSQTMRQKRRQRAEEKAMKVPIKMLFPIVFFIFPSLFIVILAPAILRIIDVLGTL